MNKVLIIFLLLSLMSLTCTFPSLRPQASSEGEPSDGPEASEEPAAQSIANPNQPLLQPCSSSQASFVTDLDVRQATDIPEPRAHEPWRDPVFGSCVVRVTDRKADPAENDASKGMKNEYSRIQSFNADGSLFLIRSLEAYWYVYDTATLQNLGITPINIDPRWDASNPDKLYYSDGTRLMGYDIRSGEVAQVHDFANDFPGKELVAVWTRYEGSPSRDTRYWGLMAQNMDWLTTDILVYDLVENKVISSLELPGEMSIDHVTMSPLGTYLLASYDNYCDHGELGSIDHPCGLMVYDRDLQNARGLLRIYGHSDTALDNDGKEVVIYQDIDTDHISMLDLASGEVTALQPIDFSNTAIGFHFSGLAFNRPGWTVISTYNGGHPQHFTWMDDSIFLIELLPGGRIVRLAHTHSIWNEEMEHDYWAEPHASANQDLTRILFTSNWGRTGTEEVDTYMILLEKDWPDRIP